VTRYPYSAAGPLVMRRRAIREAQRRAERMGWPTVVQELAAAVAVLLLAVVCALLGRFA